MKIKFRKKFSDKDLDKFIHDIFKNFNSNPNDKYLFDLTEVEFISNQELLVFSAILKSFRELNIKFSVEFFKKGVSTSEISDRVKRQIIQIWEVWQIWKIVNPTEYLECFDIDGRSIERLKGETGYFPKLSELYNRYGITPFITLEYIQNYNEKEIQKIIRPIYNLNSVIENILKLNNCYHPFTSQSLSTIVTEELYLNFLDHATTSSFPGMKLMAFMSLSFQKMLDETKFNFDEIQETRKNNFENENIYEAINFFYDKKKKTFKNHSYIQFSFLDFGQGIVNTLKGEFLNQIRTEKENFNESDVLKFAFNHDSSRHPISNDFAYGRNIPRGLFDALTIVKRYDGLLIARSNYGKILFDFSEETEVEKAVSYFGNSKQFFPGTLISLYIPAVEKIKSIDTSSIKPKTSFLKTKIEKINHLSINSVIQTTNQEKKDLYNSILSHVRNSIISVGPTLTVISFRESDLLERRILKKILFFLLSDYEINNLNNVIIIDFKHYDLINEIDSEILLLDQAIKNYKLHPLPIVNYDDVEGKLDIKWLGIYDQNDRKRLDGLLHEDFSIAKTDFNDPNNMIGHLHAFDVYGNLKSVFPNKDNLKGFFLAEKRIIQAREAKRILQKHNCIRNLSTNVVYLCNGNYYQKEYVQLSNILNDKVDCAIITNLLFNQMKTSIEDLKNYKLIGISNASQKMLRSLAEQGIIKEHEYLVINNSHTLQREININIKEENQKYVLICDVISTGFLTIKLNEKLKEVGSSIEYIAVIVSTIDEEFTPSKSLATNFKGKIFNLIEHSIRKYNRTAVKEEIFSKETIRVNPYTDIPITLSINETKFNETVIFTTEINYVSETNEIVIQNSFLENLDPKDISIGHLKFNNVIHPYFFNTINILSGLNANLLTHVFKKIRLPGLYTENIKVFYPRHSGIEKFDFNKLKQSLSNQNIEEIAMERIGTIEGWRFPHNIDYLSTKIENNICFILDDGSCSGDSLIQMIDEISFYQAKEIVLLCIIGRVDDHKREFFSRLSEIKVKGGMSIPISIFFASHWHIPTYYLDENPNTKEINWLNDLIHLQNTPRGIKRIATNILNEISAKSGENFQDFKYLPKEEVGGKLVIPKKDLLLIREELGKVIGYRLYKESFIFFDSFVKKYENRIPSKNRYKEIELLCATFLYEPYLYVRIVDVLPDIVELIEEFVRVLIFSDQRIYDSLTYKWNKRDIIHLFFIVFREEKLLLELNISNFKSLITFTLPKESALSYVLYKILNYFPLNAEQFESKKIDKEIKDLLTKLISLEPNLGKEVTRFYSFISSLPSRIDFRSQLSALQDNYLKQVQSEYHDDQISFGHNVSLFLSALRQCITLLKDHKNLVPEKIIVIKKTWFDILEFINPILSFSITFPEFLIPYPYFRLYNKLESGSKSLRGIVGEIEDTIFALGETFGDIEKLRLVDINIQSIQSDFQVNSIFHQVVEKPETLVNDFIDELKSALSSLDRRIVINELKADSTLRMAIPQYYSSQLIIKELATNMNNHSNNSDSSTITVNLSFHSETCFVMQLTNSKNDEVPHKSSGEGVKCLKLLADSNLFGFKYDSINQANIYIQNLKFTIF